jgi:arylsulfatase A-like enzyme
MRPQRGQGVGCAFKLALEGIVMKPAIRRREFFERAAAGLLAGLFASRLSRAGGDKRPNLLFIMSDDHTAQALGAYGSTINATPNIDRLADGGMRFDNCFCTNSICAPSRAVILTGKYSHLNGLLDNRTRFDGDQVTFPKLLQEAGYRTAIVGKWHLQSDPTGFDEWNVLPGQGAYHDPVMIHNGERTRHTGYVTEVITEQALNWLDSTDRARPFCLMLHHKAPHANWEASEEYGGLFAGRDIPKPETFDDDYATRTAQIRNHRLKVGPLQWELHFEKRFGPIPEMISEQEVREWVYQRYIKDYLRCVASVDESVGRVLDYLDVNDLKDNTVVVYTSDQGFFLGEHGLYDKRFMYEEALRMPLLIRYPREIPEGSTCDEIVLNLDFAATFLDYAGVRGPGGMQGRSLRDLAAGEKLMEWRDAMYYRFYEEAYGVGPHEGIRTQRYKLIHFLYGDEGWELYDLQADPREVENLYPRPEHAALVEQLNGRMTVLKQQYAVP